MVISDELSDHNYISHQVIPALSYPIWFFAFSLVLPPLLPVAFSIFSMLMSFSWLTSFSQDRGPAFQHNKAFLYYFFCLFLLICYFPKSFLNFSEYHVPLCNSIIFHLFSLLSVPFLYFSLRPGATHSLVLISHCISFPKLLF